LTRYEYTLVLAAGVAYEKDLDSTVAVGPGFALAVPIFNFGQGDRMRTRAMLCQNVQMTRDLCLQIQQEVDTYYEGMVISQKRASCAEPNFLEDDLVNLGLAELLDADAYVVVNIDKGGARIGSIPGSPSM